MTTPTIDMETLDGMPEAPTPSADDVRPRTPGEPANPEAPYGYIKDRISGELRPKLTRGRIGRTSKTKSPAKAPTAPPANRAATKPRTAPVRSVSQQDRAQQAYGALQGVWYLAAHLPAPPAGTVILGRNVSGVHTRVLASAEILTQQSEGLASAAGIAAKHSTPVARFLDNVTSTDGAAWVLPVIMALVPFAGAMAAVWRAPLAEIETLADVTRKRVAMMSPAPPIPTEPAPAA